MRPTKKSRYAVGAVVEIALEGVFGRRGIARLAEAGRGSREEIESPIGR